MSEWLNSKELAQILAVTDRTAQRMVRISHYKGLAMKTRQIKSKKGKPAILVLWDTETNQPAQITRPVRLA